MDKFAQERSFLNKLREKTNVTGIAAEKFFNKEFADAMNTLRTSDEKIRKIMMGDVPEIANFQMKELLAQVNSSLKTRQYVDAFTQLGSIHNQLQAISTEIVGLKFSFSKVHEDMLLKNYKEDDSMSFEQKKEVAERRRKLLELQKRLATDSRERLVKQAFLTDFFKNVGTEQGRALIAWEKRYPNEVAKWRDGTAAMLSSAKDIYTMIIGQLKLMAKARSVRKIDPYMDAANAMLPSISSFDKAFKKYYQDSMAPLIKKLELDNPGAVPSETSKPSDPTPEILQNQEVVSVKPNSDVPTSLQTLEPATSRSPGIASGPITDPGIRQMMPQRLPLPSSVSDEKNGPSGLADPFPLKAANHQQFYRVLEKFASESPLILKTMISKYAKSIINSDLATSVKLSKIASNIKVEE